MAKSARINAKRKPASPQTFIQRSRAKGAAEKATYHNITGAGGKVKRAFLGVTKEEAEAMKRTLVTGMQREQRRQAGRG
jgi:hypothetical protein